MVNCDTTKTNWQSLKIDQRNRIRVLLGYTTRSKVSDNFVKRFNSCD